MSKSSSLVAVLVTSLLLFSSALSIPGDDGWVNINGNVNYKGQPVCAMVLANGQYAFSCSGDGSFSYNVPLDANGEITVQVFCSGRAPYRQTIDALETEALVIAMEDTDSNAGLDVSTKVQATSSTRCNLSGTITSNGQPVCSMVLANGQYEFTCSGDGSFDLNIPLDNNGQITFYSFCSGFQPYKYIYTPEEISFSDDYDEDGYTIDEGDSNDMDPGVYPGSNLPPVLGPNPSYRVAVFYYPWYGNPAKDGIWVHWNWNEDDQNVLSEPDPIASDYYPVLGAYSVNDPAVVAQHFAWLRDCGVGVVISSWWGQNSFEDRAASVLLEQGERYGIKVAFHLEPYAGRTVELLVQDIEYLYQMYGQSPAFYRTTKHTLWTQGEKEQGLFFLWDVANSRLGDMLSANDWQQTLDQIHSLPDGGIVIACAKEREWVIDGHFDGLYSYDPADDDPNVFDWSIVLPEGAWYIPTVSPGVSAVRINYPPESNIPRQNGELYEFLWGAALDSPIEPEMVTITSFNEWHEGTQIEPAMWLDEIPSSEPSLDYGPLPPIGYLMLTKEWVDKYLSKEWREVSVYQMRIRFSTTSDWTGLSLEAGGGLWIHPEIVATNAEVGLTPILRLFPLSGSPEVETPAYVVVDSHIYFDEGHDAVTFHLNRGHLGSSTVEFYQVVDSSEVLLEKVTWSGIDESTPLNTYAFDIPISYFTK